MTPRRIYGEGAALPSDQTLPRRPGQLAEAVSPPAAPAVEVPGLADHSGADKVRDLAAHALAVVGHGGSESMRQAYAGRLNARGL